MALSNSNTIAFSDSSAAGLGLLCLVAVQTSKNHYFYETTKIDIYGENKLALLWYLLSESSLAVGRGVIYMHQGQKVKTVSM